MGATTEISWAHSTFNPWIGCQKVSPACQHCYAERDMDKRFKRVAWGPLGTGSRVKTSDEYWRKPMDVWNRQAEESGERRRVFCASLSDVFEDWQGPIIDNSDAILPGQVGLLTMDDLRRDLFALIDATPQLDWLLLTKRPENVRRMWPAMTVDVGMNDGFLGWADRTLRNGGRPANTSHRSNVWLGCSVENQEYANKRIPELLRCRDLAPVLFLSCEPLLGPVGLRRWFGPQSEGQWLNTIECGHDASEYGIDWVIAGGESGPNARPSHPDWFRSLRDQCVDAHVPYHFKQWGEWRPKLVSIAGDPAPVCRWLPGSSQWGVLDRDGDWSDLTTPWNGREDTDSHTGEVTMVRVGTKASGRVLDARTWDELPTGGTDAQRRL